MLWIKWSGLQENDTLVSRWTNLVRAQPLLVREAGALA
jgi:hypothetical protein